jgi:hypothetical protein
MAFYINFPGQTRTLVPKERIPALLKLLRELNTTAKKSSNRTPSLESALDNDRKYGSMGT